LRASHSSVASVSRQPWGGTSTREADEVSAAHQHGSAETSATARPIWNDLSRPKRCCVRAAVHPCGAMPWPLMAM